MSSPADILRLIFERVSSNLNTPIVTTPDIANNIEEVCRSVSNGACVRLLLACSLAKVYMPTVDIRKPYTKIGTSDAYSGRTYDENYIQSFVIEHNLPCNKTTAWLTPAFRNRDIILTQDIDLVGRPPRFTKLLFNYLLMFIKVGYLPKTFCLKQSEDL